MKPIAFAQTSSHCSIYLKMWTPAPTKKEENEGGKKEQNRKEQKFSSVEIGLGLRHLCTVVFLVRPCFCFSLAVPFPSEALL